VHGVPSTQLAKAFLHRFGCRAPCWDHDLRRTRARMLAAVIPVDVWMSCAWCLCDCRCPSVSNSPSVRPSAQTSHDKTACGVLLVVHTTWADVVYPRSPKIVSCPIRPRTTSSDRPESWPGGTLADADDETAERTTGRAATVSSSSDSIYRFRAAPQPNNRNAQCHPRLTTGGVVWCGRA
jgi:hypothetical protein